MSGPTMKTPFPGIGSTGSATAGGASATTAMNTADKRSNGGIVLSSMLMPPMAA
jgi:hypothetical protein